MNAPVRIEISRMTSKGQVLIPKALRDQAGLKPNELVSMSLDDDGKILLGPSDPRSLETPDERYTRVKAALRAARGKYPNPNGMTTDQFMHWLRGDWEP